jgi:hypothetical protein
LAVYIISWPYLYADIPHRLREYWGYIIKRGVGGDLHAFNLDPLKQAFFTMPEFMLVMLLIGVFAILFKKRRVKTPFERCLILWLILPILRVSIPGAINFNGIRHFLEFLPAASLIAGYGASHTVKWLYEWKRLSRPLIQGCIFILLALNLAYIYANFYPFLHIYYNQFTGGLDGAHEHFLNSEAPDYWASSYRQGIYWLDNNAPPNSSVQALIANWLLELSGPVLLRPDIHVIPSGKLQDFSILDSSPNATFLMFIVDGAPEDEIEYCMTRKKPVYEIMVDNIPILQIYQFGPSS